MGIPYCTEYSCSRKRASAGSRPAWRIHTASATSWFVRTRMPFKQRGVLRRTNTRGRADAEAEFSLPHQVDVVHALDRIEAPEADVIGRRFESAARSQRHADQVTLVRPSNHLPDRRGSRGAPARGRDDHVAILQLVDASRPARRFDERMTRAGTGPGLRRRTGCGARPRAGSPAGTARGWCPGTRPPARTASAPGSGAAPRGSAGREEGGLEQEVAEVESGGSSARMRW